MSKYKVNTSILKNHLHIDKRYEIYRNRVEIKVRRSHTSRCKKLNINSVLTQEELDKKITMDSICKEIMTDCFQNELIIDKADNLGRCWSER